MAHINSNSTNQLRPEPTQIRGMMSQLQLHLEAGTLIHRNQPLEISLTVVPEERKVEVPGEQAAQVNTAKKSCS